MKVCKTCKQEKDISEFSANGTSKKGTVVYAAHCKPCRAAKARKERDNASLRLKCSCCGSVFKFVNKGKRTEKFCDQCYPIYRTAYSMFANIKNRSSRKKMSFDLTLDFLLDRLKEGVCPRTGITFTFSGNGSNAGSRRVSTPSVDKIDPKKGYTKDNVQVVCWWYNLSKATFTDDEVIELCKKVVKQSLSST